MTTKTHPVVGSEYVLRARFVPSYPILVRVIHSDERRVTYYQLLPTDEGLVRGVTLTTSTPEFLDRYEEAS